MNKKKLSIIIGIIIVLFLISSYLYSLKSLQTGERDFALPGEADVAAVHIVPPEGKKILLKKDKSGQWWVNDENHANERAVSDLIRTLRYFTVRQPVSITQQEQVNESLYKDGVMVNVLIDTYLFDFFDFFGLFKIQRVYNSFLVGENAKEIEGTYMRMVESENPYIVYRPGYEGGIADVFTPKQRIWLDPVVVDLEPGQIKKVKVIANENPGESFILKMREDFKFDFFDIDKYPLPGKIKVDTSRVIRLLSSFKELYYENLLTNDALSESEKFIFPDYAFRIVVYDWNNDQYSFNVYRRYRDAGLLEPGELSPLYDPDRFYLELEDGRRAVAKYYVFGRVLRPFSFFLKEH